MQNDTTAGDTKHVHFTYLVLLLYLAKEILQLPVLLDDNVKTTKEIITVKAMSHLRELLQRQKAWNESTSVFTVTKTVC